MQSHSLPHGGDSIRAFYTRQSQNFLSPPHGGILQFLVPLLYHFNHSLTRRGQYPPSTSMTTAFQSTPSHGERYSIKSNRYALFQSTPSTRRRPFSCESTRSFHFQSTPPHGEHFFAHFIHSFAISIHSPPTRETHTLFNIVVQPRYFNPLSLPRRGDQCFS